MVKCRPALLEFISKAEWRQTQVDLMIVVKKRLYNPPPPPCANKKRSMGWLYAYLIAALVVVSPSRGAVDYVTDWAETVKLKGAAAVIACVDSRLSGASRVVARLEAAQAAAGSDAAVTFGQIDAARDAAICERLNPGDGARLKKASSFLIALTASGTSLRVPSAIAASPSALVDFALRVSRPVITLIHAGDDVRALLQDTHDDVAFIFFSSRKVSKPTETYKVEALVGPGLAAASGLGGDNGQASDMGLAFFRVATLLYGRSSFFSVHEEDVRLGRVKGLEGLAIDDNHHLCGGDCVVCLRAAEAEGEEGKKFTTSVLTLAAARELPYARDVCARAAAASSTDDEGGGGSLSSLSPPPPLTGEAAGLFAWIFRSKWPKLVELTSATLADACIDGRYLALASLGAIDDDAQALARALDSIADPISSLLPPQVRNSFIFALVERAAAVNFTNQFASGVAHELIVIDTLGRRFWQDATVREEEDMDTW